MIHSRSSCEMTVVGDERIDLLLDHRVAALLNVDAWRGDEARRLPIQTACAFGQCRVRQSVRRRRRCVAGFECGFAIARAVARTGIFARQRQLWRTVLVLKSFEFGRDVAFGAFEVWRRWYSAGSSPGAPLARGSARWQ